jgi:hypothetical protein
MGRAVVSGPEILKVIEQTWVRRLPTQRLLCVGTRRGLVSCEDRSERTVGLLWHGLDRKFEAPTNHGGDVEDCIPLVAHGVPRGACRNLFESQAKEHGCVEGVHRWPALSAVAGATRNARLASDLRQHARKTSVTVVVDGPWQTNCAGAHSAYGQRKDLVN